MGEPMMHGRSLQKLGRELADELDATRDEAVLAEARERLFERRRTPVVSMASRARAKLPTFAFAAAAAAAVAVMAMRGRAPESMAFHMGDPPERGTVGAWVAAPAAAPVALRFDDGSRFDVEPTGRARVASSTVADARLVLESGTLRGDIATGDKAGTWHVTAGPFNLMVTGTRFQMTWDPETGMLDVRDITGRVVVTGPYAAQGVAVMRGEYLRVSLKQAKLEVSASPPPPLSAPPRRRRKPPLPRPSPQAGSARNSTSRRASASGAVQCTM